MGWTQDRPPGTLTMARPKARQDKAIGPILARNLYRLGHADIVVRASDLSRLVGENTDESLTRQRISQIVNAVRVEPETIALLAKAIGVEPEELIRD